MVREMVQGGLCEKQFQWYLEMVLLYMSKEKENNQMQVAQELSR